MACHHHCETTNNTSPKYRNVLIFALIINALMFLVEMIMGAKAGAMSLFADSLDFLGDAMNYGLSLFVLSKALHTRAKMSLIKGISMLIFGVGVLIMTIYYYLRGELPNSYEMGVVGVLALLANVGVAMALYHFREGDSNMKSVWLCSRNDAIGNIAVVGASVAVFFTQSQLPDLLVAVLMASLAVYSGLDIINSAKVELKQPHLH